MEIGVNNKENSTEDNVAEKSDSYDKKDRENMTGKGDIIALDTFMPLYSTPC